MITRTLIDALHTELKVGDILEVYFKLHGIKCEGKIVHLINLEEKPSKECLNLFTEQKSKITILNHEKLRKAVIEINKNKYFIVVLAKRQDLKISKIIE